MAEAKLITWFCIIYPVFCLLDKAAVLNGFSTTGVKCRSIASR
uniref:Uncharacterized protein n=1 Tax=Neisseria meningitidis alpha522 TaxID=996307 RepID=I4E891_NEIME|nr:hypothetical protein NMALPHA522_2019 [Neisseria meningitidis alpha522]